MPVRGAQGQEGVGVGATETARGEEASSALRCMEIWGGSSEALDAISVPGVDAFVRSKPHAGAGAGGDIYYVSVCGAGEISRFLIADVAGHGSGVEGIATDLRRLMRKHINNANPSRLAERLNEEFGAVSSAGKFATALVMTYFAPSDHLIVTNAGHPRPLWYSARERAWSVLSAQHNRVTSSAAGGQVGVRNLPLGILDGTEYEQFAVALSKGDRVIAYTDALVEAADASGDQLGEHGLLELARTLPPDDPAVLAAELERGVASFRASDEAGDDLTMLVLAHNAGHPARQSIGEKFRVMGRMLGLG